MASLGLTFGVFCRGNRRAGQGRRCGNQFEPCHRYSDDGHPALTWLLALLTTGRGELAAISRKAWFFLVLSGLATGLSWLCYFRALQLGEVSKVAPIDKLSVVVAIALSFLFFGERLTPREGIGVALIVVGGLFLALK